ncbi:MAG: LTA synthase family protein [Bradymonadales bacterium]|jgi:phosphoglycerol transferase MdoB-like AlkP superfamily enzyme
MMKASATFAVSEERTHFPLFFLNFIIAVIIGAILTLALFLRPVPYGYDYVINIWHYMPHAMFYMVFGLTALTLPFFLLTQFRRLRYRRVFYVMQSVLLAISLFINQADNEVLRYVNVHITFDFLRTYLLATKGIPDSILTMFATDPGGPYLSILLFLLPVAYVFLSVFIYKKFQFKSRIILERGIIALLFAVFIVLPLLFYTPLFGSKNRQAKVAPPLVLTVRAVQEYMLEENDFSDIDANIRAVQSRWLREERDENWSFIDAKYPLRKRYQGVCTKEPEDYHIIVISFESLRAKSLKLFNPEQEVEAAPYMRALAESEHGSYYTRYYTNGHPTIAGFMAMHTALLPHSRYTTAKKFTTVDIESYASILRRHGYEAIFFGGSDPDWDNQRFWLNKWYDHIFYSPKYEEKDRLVMQHAARYLKERDSTKPFALTVFLISNHVPFEIPEPELKLNDAKDFTQKILNTIHYDDDVLREFIESIKDEPWFDRSIIFITGDHGMDLGDRGESADYYNLRREVTALPLIVYGKHPRLPKGEQNTLSSHADLAPTILDLLGICDDNDFIGHSLLSVKEDRQIFSVKFKRFAVETLENSAYFPTIDSGMLFKASDLWQREDIGAHDRETLQKLRQSVIEHSQLSDYLYEKGLLGSTP